MLQLFGFVLRVAFALPIACLLVAGLLITLGAQVLPGEPGRAIRAAKFRTAAPVSDLSAEEVPEGPWH